MQIITKTAIIIPTKKKSYILPEEIENNDKIKAIHRAYLACRQWYECDSNGYRNRNYFTMTILLEYTIMSHTEKKG